MADFDLIAVEVAYALPHRQKIIPLLVKPGTTALEAVMQSGITAAFPEINPDAAKMGIFGQSLGVKGLAAPNTYQLNAGDRVEIYRPLTADPMETRRRRAEKSRDDNSSPAADSTL
jgi:putative ubiquitin-RnfH superfamily antitoxin RatB of RatAB toxin-antitoxin module